MRPIANYPILQISEYVNKYYKAIRDTASKKCSLLQEEK